MVGDTPATAACVKRKQFANIVAISFSLNLHVPKPKVVKVHRKQKTHIYAVKNGRIGRGLNWILTGVQSSQ